jgi:hypothetical protein
MTLKKKKKTNDIMFFSFFFYGLQKLITWTVVFYKIFRFIKIIFFFQINS